MRIRDLENILFESEVISEARANVLDIKYDDYERDPNPRVLYLGKFRHPNTGNTLMGGVNLNYLSDQDIERLRQDLGDIMGAGRSLKARWEMGHQLLPDIFPGSGYQKGDGAYRTYKDDMVHIQHRSQLKALDKKETPTGPVTPKRPAPSTTPTAAIDRAKELQAAEPKDIDEPMIEPKEIDIKPEDVPEPEPVERPKRVSRPKPKPEIKPKPKPKVDKDAPERPKRSSAKQAEEAPKLPSMPEPEPEPEQQPEMAAEPEELDLGPEPGDEDITPGDIPMPEPEL